MKRKVGKVLVVGSGIGGIRAALDLAENGYGVTLIDRAPHMGGVLSQLDYQFPSDRCGMCKMLPLVDRDSASQACLRRGLFHDNIDILLSTTIQSVEGEPGNFQVSLKQKPNWVDPQRCTGCGRCTDVCPVTVPDEFNAGLSMRKAVYLPIPHNIPNHYVIDLAACNRCGECEKVCPEEAIALSSQERKRFRILVVDDERIVRDSLQAWLSDEEGFAVEMASSGPEALALLSSGPYHLMLLDIKMPGMDGVEALTRAMEIQPDLSVIMMTAYATVETAVEAMKVGAQDYLIKPFQPDDLIPKIIGIYEDFEAARGPRIDVGAIVLCGGSAYYNPAEGKNVMGYGDHPNVVTNVEFERIISGTGPCGGRLVRPGDGKAVRKAAWIQCVGSRDLQTNADFCSNVCCMMAMKEAVLAGKKAAEDDFEATIFFMDMRTFGKSFQRYRDAAEASGVRFVRGRVHSVDTGASPGDLSLRYVEPSGKCRDESFDLVVLSVGQRPPKDTAQLADALDIELGAGGFVHTDPLDPVRTAREGILAGGSFAGLRDISDSVILSSAAALSASRVVHGAGGSLALEETETGENRDVARERPEILVVICRCGRLPENEADDDETRNRLMADPAVTDVLFVDKVCTDSGMAALEQLLAGVAFNRLLLGACQPYLFFHRWRKLAATFGLAPKLVDVVDLNGQATSFPDGNEDGYRMANRITALRGGVARLKHADPNPVPKIPVVQRALVVGGGIAGMTAAQAIADHGFGVDLVERSTKLGGNLNWVDRTIDGLSTHELLEETCRKIDKHPNITVHTETTISGGFGQVGCFLTTIETADKKAETMEHGAVVLATGGREATTTSYGYGTHPGIVTQMELEKGLKKGVLRADSLESVVMIQCVDSREEPRNYCSRVCCLSALKNALLLKEQNADIRIYVFYRDMMSYGFAEAWYTKARKAGIVFIQYETTSKPLVKHGGDLSSGGLQVMAEDPILGLPLEITADLVVLATGVVANLPAELAGIYGAETDRDGFFLEAEAKWRPVESLAEGVFCCGLAHSPRSIAESIATAQAASMRALRTLSRASLPAGSPVARVRDSLCSRCERCIPACPYGARMLDVDNEKIQVNPVMCQGCGACASVCPNGAAILDGYGLTEMLETIDAAFTL